MILFRALSGSRALFDSDGPSAQNRDTTVFNFNVKHQLRLISYGLLTSKLLKGKKLSIKLKSKIFTKINLILIRIIWASIQGASCFCDICNL